MFIYIVIFLELESNLGLPFKRSQSDPQMLQSDRYLNLFHDINYEIPGYANKLTSKKVRSTDVS